MPKISQTHLSLMSQMYLTILRHYASKVCKCNRPDVFCEKCVLRNFAKFTGKHLCQSLFFNKVAVLSPETLLKKRLWHRCFSVNSAKFLRTHFFTEHLRWLLNTCDGELQQKKIYDKFDT